MSLYPHIPSSSTEGIAPVRNSKILDMLQGTKESCKNSQMHTLDQQLELLLIEESKGTACSFQGATTGACVDSGHPLRRKWSMFLLDDLRRDPVKTRTGISPDESEVLKRDTTQGKSVLGQESRHERRKTNSTQTAAIQSLYKERIGTSKNFRMLFTSKAKVNRSYPNKGVPQSLNKKEAAKSYVATGIQENTNQCLPAATGSLFRYGAI
ncbi:uncharacterized protein AAGF69_006152 [Amazona ochrocephala]